MKNPFLGEKFIHSLSKDDLNRLLTNEWYKVPPISVEIDPSNRCNSACIWCMYEDYRNTNQDMIPYDKMKEIIHELGDMGCKTITFTGGGEPLTNTDIFPDAFYWVIENGMQLGLITNGVDAYQYIDHIARTCKFVRFSVDAATEETYQKVHLSYKFNDVLENARLLSKSGIDIGMAFLVHPDNYHEAGQFATIGANLGVTYVEYRPCWMPDLTISKRIALDVIEQVDSVKERMGSTKVFVRMGRFQEHIDGDRGFDECLGTPLVGVVSADLNMYLCCQNRGVPGMSFGNLKNNTIRDLWYGNKRREIVKSIDIENCPPCRYKTYNSILCALKNCDHVDFL